MLLFLELSNDNIVSAIDRTQTVESPFPKYKRSIFFNQIVAFLSKVKDRCKLFVFCFEFLNHTVKLLQQYRLEIKIFGLGSLFITDH